MPRLSAGLLMYRVKDGVLQVLLAHPGGPYFANKDKGAWTIPKGEPDMDEDLLLTAQREFEEETGVKPAGPFTPLKPVKQKGGKIVHAWAFEGDCDPADIKSNTFTMEWPPKSNRQQEFPEIDRAGFFDLATASKKIKDGQEALIEELATIRKSKERGSSSAMKRKTGHDLRRCPWAKTEQYIEYHDKEWGVPVHDDRTLFEFLVLEGAQAGLSWETVLKKRENYQQAFDQFDPAIVAKYGKRKQQSLLSNPGIIRNRLKIEAAIQNAKAFLAVKEEFGTFDKYIWGFVGHKPKQNARKSLAAVPAHTVESDAMSKDLKRRGFKFVGTTICYAFMQAVGMVNDHLVECFRHKEARQNVKKNSPRK